MFCESGSGGGRCGGRGRLSTGVCVADAATSPGGGPIGTRNGAVASFFGGGAGNSAPDSGLGLGGGGSEHWKDERLFLEQGAGARVLATSEEASAFSCT